MPNIGKMQEVFEKALEKYESAEKRYLNQIAGNGVRDLYHEYKVIEQAKTALRKEFEAAKNS
ncbi:hypothetical protein [Parageobacillus galactosidasius]|uniref:Uncharacterized protein n=1 Tax=Parageobacillus galactosidasius TaxID=883812 RepID=A0A226QS70_9BACL|nr:hypothetical protein [Parageobacillus galactosidasius]OXB94874.1 hypothetical protein B9L23_08405 [Parageobacillus galactosidasius]